jgi:hypothetical protein
MNDPGTTAILEGLVRIETRQAAYEVVAHRILGILEVHNEKLDAILEAATTEPGPSPVAEALNKLVAAVEEQTRLLTSLPEVLAVAIREELHRELEAEGYETEPAVPGAFDRPDSERE